MKIATIGPPHNSGTDNVRAAALQRQLEQARKAGWPQLERADLTFGPFGTITHEPTGRLYRRHRGELGDLVYSSATAFYLTDWDEIIFLEDPPGGSPKTVSEREQYRADRERRRAQQAKSTPRGMRR
jgi:hypothetical protein